MVSRLFPPSTGSGTSKFSSSLAAASARTAEASAAAALLSALPAAVSARSASAFTAAASSSSAWTTAASATRELRVVGLAPGGLKRTHAGLEFGDALLERDHLSRCGRCLADGVTCLGRHICLARLLGVSADALPMRAMMRANMFLSPCEGVLSSLPGCIGMMRAPERALPRPDVSDVFGGDTRRHPCHGKAFIRQKAVHSVGE